VSCSLGEARRDRRRRARRSHHAEEADIRELKKRNRLLEQENEVLRRAAIYLGKGVLPK
jgi:transposase